MSDRRAVSAAFTDIARRLPGRFDDLRRLLETAEDAGAVTDFVRLILAYEFECTDLERKVREPWRR